MERDDSKLFWSLVLVVVLGLVAGALWVALSMGYVV